MKSYIKMERKKKTVYACVCVYIWLFAACYLICIFSSLFIPFFFIIFLLYFTWETKRNWTKYDYVASSSSSQMKMLFKCAIEYIQMKWKFTAWQYSRHFGRLDESFLLIAICECQQIRKSLIWHQRMILFIIIHIGIIADNGYYDVWYSSMANVIYSHHKSYKSFRKMRKKIVRKSIKIENQ